MASKGFIERWKTILFQLKHFDNRLRFLEMNMENVFQEK